MGIYKDTIEGKLIARRQAVGNLSEGPAYILIPTGKFARWGKIELRKKVMRWQNDPVLHGYIDQTVSIVAEIIETKDTITVEYIEVSLKQ